MSAQENEMIVRNLFEALDNPGSESLKTIMELLDENVNWCVVPYGAPYLGHAGVKSLLDVAWAATKPNHPITNLFASDEWVCVEYPARSTVAAGKLDQLNVVIPETRVIDVMGCSILHIKDHKIDLAREYYDVLSMLRQLGVEFPKHTAS
ncbi:MAG: nuclear transport factor 2 family protein [Anaerolineae bacterium]|nr:nuclear transport factor 2 family protein [Anaerolineae bacterium]